MIFVFFFKQKTAYEMRISDWSSDVCSSDLAPARRQLRRCAPACAAVDHRHRCPRRQSEARRKPVDPARRKRTGHRQVRARVLECAAEEGRRQRAGAGKGNRSEEHTSELQSLMRISYAVFCLKKKKKKKHYDTHKK